MIEFFANLTKGGIVMIPLGICSLAALTVLIEKFVVLRRASKPCHTLFKELRNSIYQGDFNTASDKAKSVTSPIAAVMAQGLEAFLMKTSPRDAMSEEAGIQLSFLQKRLAVLDTVVTVAPLLGLLGTVIGMISSFNILALTGTEHPAGITGGIAEALIATGTGLVIAIFALVGFNWCQEKIRIISEEMEQRASQLMNWLSTAQHEMEIKDEALVNAL